jgi:hypothetical protein
LNRLSENAADLVVVLTIVGLIAGAILFVRARGRHVQRLRRAVLGETPLPAPVRQALAKVASSDTAEMAAIGAVTFVDLAWHYTLADPSIWDHFQGVETSHITDALQNLDVLKASLGERALPILNNVAEYLQRLEASQVFGDVLDKLAHIGGVSDAATIVLDAHSPTLLDSILTQAAGVDHSAVVGSAAVQTKVGAVGDALIQSKAEAAAQASSAGLLNHIPLVTLGFAAYRGWRRAQKGARWPRNLEFAAIEVTTRAGGGLVGGQVGGMMGTVIVPGVGTIIGGVVGAVAGAVGGALLGESLKRRHAQSARQKLDTALTDLGQRYLDDSAAYRRLTEVFIEQERVYTDHMLATRRRLGRYRLLPWRALWPDQKLILLQEMADSAADRLATIKQETIDTLDRLAFMRDEGRYRELGVILWSTPAMCQQLDCEPAWVQAIETANARLRQELVPLGATA